MTASGLHASLTSATGAWAGASGQGSMALQFNTAAGGAAGGGQMSLTLQTVPETQPSGAGAPSSGSMGPSQAAGSVTGTPARGVAPAAAPATGLGIDSDPRRWTLC